MQKIALLFVVITSLIGCGQHLSEVWINKNSSGKVKVTIDAGGMIDMIGGVMQGMGDDTEKNNSSPLGEGKIDSTIVFYDLTPESVKETLDRPELLKNMIFNVKGDQEKKEMKISFSLQYNSQDELEAFFTQLSKIEEGGQTSPMSQDDLKTMFSKQTVDYKNGIVRVNREENFSDTDKQLFFGEESQESLDSLRIIFDMLEDENPDLDENARQKIESVQEMFEVKSIFHLPGKVIFTNDPKAVIDGNVLTITDNIWEAILRDEREGTQDLIIKYNPK